MQILTVESSSESSTVSEDEEDEETATEDKEAAAIEVAPLPDIVPTLQQAPANDLPPANEPGIRSRLRPRIPKKYV